MAFSCLIDVDAQLCRALEVGNLQRLRVAFGFFAADLQQRPRRKRAARPRVHDSHLSLRLQVAFVAGDNHRETIFVAEAVEVSLETFYVLKAERRLRATIRFRRRALAPFAVCERENEQKAVAASKTRLSNRRKLVLTRSVGD